MTAALAVRTSPMSQAAPPLVRLLPAPVLEPPFEDDAGDLDRVRSGAAARTSRHRAAGEPELALTPSLRWPGGRSGRATASSPAGTAPISEAKLAAHRYLARCVEVLGGFRPMVHLRILTAPAVFDRIAVELARPRSAPECHTGARPPATLPTDRLWTHTARLTPAPGGRVMLRHLRVCEPRDGVAEVAAILGRGDQVWAMAVRLERHRGAWLCYHLEVL
jgi:hypothetical protein